MTYSARIVAVLGLLTLLSAIGCTERIRVSRGSRIPPEHRGSSSAEITETFTRHLRGERLSVAATLIDFAYVRAVTRERGRSVDSEREAYQRYLRRQTTFYVHLVLHGRESCRTARRDGRGSDEDDADALSFDAWSFVLVSSGGQEVEPSSVDAGPTQLAPSGGCLVQGYVHFDGNIRRNVEWIQLEASLADDRHLRADLRWDVELFSPARRGQRPAKRAPSGPPEERRDQDAPEEQSESDVSEN